MAQRLFGLAFKTVDDYTLSPYPAASGQEALGFTEQQMLELAQVLLPCPSPLPGIYFSDGST